MACHSDISGEEQSQKCLAAARFYLHLAFYLPKLFQNIIPKYIPKHGHYQSGEEQSQKCLATARFHLHIWWRRIYPPPPWLLHSKMFPKYYLKALSLVLFVLLFPILFKHFLRLKLNVISISQSTLHTAFR